MTATDSAVELAHRAAQAAADKLATDIMIFDVSDRLALTDCFVVATGANDRQVGAIVDEVEEKLRQTGVKAVRREGEREGRWVLLDFLDIVVHVQQAEERTFYALDRLWKDCPMIPFTDAAAPADGARLSVPTVDSATLSASENTDTATDPESDSVSESDSASETDAGA